MSRFQSFVKRAVGVLLLSSVVLLGVRYFRTPTDHVTVGDDGLLSRVRSDSVDRFRDQHQHYHQHQQEQQQQSQLQPIGDGGDEVVEQQQQQQLQRDDFNGQSDASSSSADELVGRRGDRKIPLPLIAERIADERLVPSTGDSNRKLSSSLSADVNRPAADRGPQQSVLSMLSPVEVDRRIHVVPDGPAASSSIIAAAHSSASNSSTVDDSQMLWGQFANRRGRLTPVDRVQQSQQQQLLPAAAIDDRTLQNSSSAAAVSTSVGGRTSASDQQQQQQYIPHRCPPDFDKIDDPEYEWFQTKVVQRSPAAYSRSSTLNDEILILTPIANAEKHLRRYFANLCSLVYPHRLISVVLGEDSSSDKTVELAEQLIEQLGPYFRRIELVRLPSGTESHRSDVNRRHDPSWQFQRRRHLATVRNRLLIRGLGVVSPSVRWVLWIDSDTRHIPRDLVRHLVAVNQSVVVPNCLWKKDNGDTATYDRNTWQETDLSRAELRVMAPDALMLEGYGPSRRRTLNDVKADGDVVPVDGVGGCVLLVDADLHRQGLVFPPFVFDHHIETEGFAKAVARYGARMYGLPSVNVIHW